MQYDRLIGIIMSSICLSVCLWRCALWLKQQVSGQVNRKCAPRSRILQLSTRYSHP